MTAPSPTSAAPSTGSGAVGGLGRSLRIVFGNPALRRIQLALAGSSIGDWAYMTAVIVWAYDIGGPTVVGVWVATRYLLMALFAPALASMADRVSRRAVMVGSDLVRASLVAAAAGCLVAETSPAPVFVLATAASVVGTAFRPAQLAWMPDLVDRPDELTAANGVTSTSESLAFFLGPAIAGLLLVVADVSTVFGLNALTFLWSAVVVLRVRAKGHPVRVPAPGAGGRGLAGAVAGFSAVRHDRDLLMVVALVASQSLVTGAEYVFAVSIAVEVLETGPEGLGALEAALGVGAIAGGAVVLARAGRLRLGRGLLLGVLLWAVPLLLVAAVPEVWMAFAAMLLIGFGNPFVDVNYATLVQRIAPVPVIGRVFGVVESVIVAMMALGSLAMPVLIAAFGLRTALLSVGAVAVLTALPWWRRLGRLDDTLAAPPGLEALNSLSLFRPLSPARVETLARRLVRLEVPAGQVVVREGDEADRFYVIDRGLVRVTRGGAELRTEGPGEFFGEIGLLRDVPRTATVAAVEDTALWCLDRDDFLGAVTGNDESHRLVTDVASRRMGG